MASSVATLEARLLDDPDDEAAWHAYAAWLRATGDPRGEWIALQAFADTAHEREWLAARVTEQHARWTPLAVWTQHCVFRHGFPVAATLHVAGRSDARQLAALMGDPGARLLGSLDLAFRDGTPSRGLTPLEGASLERLRSLRSVHHMRGNRVARVLGLQPALNLRVLDLRRSGLTDDGRAALRGLRALHLQHNRVTARGVAALAGSPALAGLELLDLRHNPIGPDGAAALAAAPQLDNLTALHLHAGEVGPAGVRALATSTTLPPDLVRLWRAQDTTR